MWLKAGHGYWKLGKYPIGGELAHAPKSGHGIKIAQKHGSITWQGIEYTEVTFEGGQRAALGPNSITNLIL